MTDNIKTGPVPGDVGGYAALRDAMVGKDFADAQGAVVYGKPKSALRAPGDRGVMGPGMAIEASKPRFFGLKAGSKSERNESKRMLEEALNLQMPEVTVVKEGRSARMPFGTAVMQPFSGKRFKIKNFKDIDKEIGSVLSQQADRAAMAGLHDGADMLRYQARIFKAAATVPSRRTANWKQRASGALSMQKAVSHDLRHGQPHLTADEADTIARQHMRALGAKALNGATEENLALLKETMGGHNTPRLDAMLAQSRFDQALQTALKPVLLKTAEDAQANKHILFHTLARHGMNAQDTRDFVNNLSVFKQRTENSLDALERWSAGAELTPHEYDEALRGLDAGAQMAAHMMRQLKRLPKAFTDDPMLLDLRTTLDQHMLACQDAAAGARHGSLGTPLEQAQKARAAGYLPGMALRRSMLSGDMPATLQSKVPLPNVQTIFAADPAAMQAAYGKRGASQLTDLQAQYERALNKVQDAQEAFKAQGGGDAELFALRDALDEAKSANTRLLAGIATLTGRHDPERMAAEMPKAKTWIRRCMSRISDAVRGKGAVRAHAVQRSSRALDRSRQVALQQLSTLQELSLAVRDVNVMRQLAASKMGAVQGPELHQKFDPSDLRAAAIRAMRVPPADDRPPRPSLSMVVEPDDDGQFSDDFRPAPDDAGLMAEDTPDLANDDSLDDIDNNPDAVGPFRGPLADASVGQNGRLEKALGDAEAMFDQPADLAWPAAGDAPEISPPPRSRTASDASNVSDMSDVSASTVHDDDDGQFDDDVALNIGPPPQQTRYNFKTDGDTVLDGDDETPAGDPDPTDDQSVHREPDHAAAPPPQPAEAGHGQDDDLDEYLDAAVAEQSDDEDAERKDDDIVAFVNQFAADMGDDDPLGSGPALSDRPMPADHHDGAPPPSDPSVSGARGQQPAAVIDQDDVDPDALPEDDQPIDAGPEQNDENDDMAVVAAIIDEVANEPDRDNPALAHVKSAFV
ncbi:MAG: hypothetical protein AAF899_00540 [Pseudomonadota bacterium]